VAAVPDSVAGDGTISGKAGDFTSHHQGGSYLGSNPWGIILFGIIWDHIWMKSDKKTAEKKSFLISQKRDSVGYHPATNGSTLNLMALDQARKLMDIRI
jgi:hypothetical protein